MKSHFFAMLSRMKNINRWGLMRNVRSENLCEHSFETAVIAHALAEIANNRLGAEIDSDKVAVCALFHDTTEILTGDMPTPVKYYNEDLKQEEEFFECEIISGILGTGTGEEWQDHDREKYGDFELVNIKIKES